VWARTRANEDVRASLEQLTTRQREILLLHVCEGLSYKEICKARGLTRRVVQRDISQAYSKLRARLRREPR
jgi:RNA polymerase sigma factor (sigma-70 family)